MIKNKNLITSIVSIFLSCVFFFIVIDILIYSYFVCDHQLFYVAKNPSESALTCTQIMNTNYIWLILIGFILLIVGIIFAILYKKDKKAIIEENEKDKNIITTSYTISGTNIIINDEAKDTNNE